LTHFLPSIAFILKTKPVTPYFFYKNLFITHGRRNRENYKKFCGVDFALIKKNGNLKIGKIPPPVFFTISHMHSAFAVE